MVYFWITVIVLLTIIEAATINLTTIWFVASAILALLASFITDNLFIQFGIFAICGVVFLVLTKPFLNKWLKGKNEKTNLDRIVGMKGVITEDVEPNMPGEVKVDGKKWTAISDKKLLKGDIVKILEIDSVKLKVDSWED